MPLPACVCRAGAMLSLGFALTACASSTGSQDAWADAIDALDGVTSVNVKHHGGGLGSEDQYKAEIINAPDLTDKQARAIAAESCEHDAEITQVRISTSSAPDPTIENVHLADHACIDADPIVRYARASTAIHNLDGTFAGSVNVLGLQAKDGQTDGPSLFVQVGATDESSLLNALGALHKQIKEFPLTFDGAVSESGTTLARDGEPIKATLSPGADLGTLLSLVKFALKLDRRAITLTDDSLTVGLASSKNLDSPEVEQLRLQANEAGIELEAGIPPFAGNAKKQDLLEELLTVPGGATVKSPHDLDTTEVSIYPNDVAGLEPAARLLVASDLTAKFRMHNPIAPDTFWIDVSPRQGSAGQADEPPAKDVSDAVAATKHVRTDLADNQGVKRVVLTFNSDGVSLTAYLQDSASASTEKLTRDTLGQLSGDLFDEVTLNAAGDSERVEADGHHRR